MPAPLSYSAGVEIDLLYRHAAEAQRKGFMLSNLCGDAVMMCGTSARLL